MNKTSIKFSISNIVFEFNYDFVYETNCRVPINNFMVNKDTADIINEIKYDSSLIKPPFQNLEATFVTPAWSYYKEERVFVMHPNKIFIGVVKLLHGFSRVETIVNTLDFSYLFQ